MEIVPYSEPLIIPLEDISSDTAPIYDYVKSLWPEPKGDQPPMLDFPIGINNMAPNMPNVMMHQPQFPMYGGNNQMNWGMPPENMMGMGGPPSNNMYIPPNQMMMNNQQMFMGDQMSQQQQPLQPEHQHQQPPSHHSMPPQEDQWMGPPGPPMQHEQQHWGPQQPPQNNGPPHFERGGGGGRGHSRWDNPRGGNYDSYRGKMNRNNQRGGRGCGPYNRRGGHPGNGRGGHGNGRGGIRLCKYYMKQGFCKTSNCAFLHSKG